MRVLLIHNSTQIENLKRVLENQSFVVDLKRDFNRALSSACVNPYRIVVIVHEPPLMDAQAFCHAIRGRGRTVPLLILVQEHEHSIGTDCLESGADDFMKSPWRFDEFLARIRSLLRRPEQIEPDEVTVGPFCIDRKMRTVRNGVRTIALTHKEFAVLDILAQHLGGVVSKEEIIEHAWGEMDGKFLERSLDTHIYRIRRKLSSRGKSPVKTVFGRGYRLG